MNLGDVTNIDAAILDLAKAEASFLTAARYAKTDYPAEAGIAMTAAGWAAFCQNKLAESESHTKQAMALHPQNGEAFFQLAKIQMHTKRPKEAIPNLRRAAELDPHFTIKAATDPDFLRFEKDVQSLIDSLRRDAESKASPAMVEAKRILDMLQEWRSEDVFQTETEVLRNVFAKAEGNFASNTFLGFLDAKSDADRVASFGSRLIGEHQQFLEKQVTGGIDSLTRFRASFQQKGTQFSYEYFNCANETLKQVEKGVRAHGDHRRKMELLNQARKQFQAAIEESRKGIQRKGTSDVWAAAISGAARGVFVTFIPAFLATLVIAFFLALVTGGLEQKGTRMESFIGSVIPLIYFPWLIIAGVIGASRRRKEVLADHQNNSAEKFGIEPPLPSVGNVQRPPPLFDATSFSNQKPRVHDGQPNSRLLRGPDKVYDLILTSVPADKKIAVIKAVCAVSPGFGLAEAKALVESARTRTVLERLSRIEADAAKEILEKAGARVELK